MNVCECTIYKMVLDLVSNDFVAWTLMTLARGYKYAWLLS